MAPKREYPDQPVVGVGGVVIVKDQALLIRRANPPYKGMWSIPGGMLGLGETLAQGVARELAEETGLEVDVLDLIEVVERIFSEGLGANPGAASPRPQYHFVIADYLCALRAGVPCAASDATELAWVREDELVKFELTPQAADVLRKAFHMARARAERLRP